MISSRLVTNGAALTRIKLLSVALTASVGANLFVAGWMFTGGVWDHRHRFPNRLSLREELVSKLSKSGAIDVAYALDQVHGEFGLRLEEARSRREEKSEVLTSEPFDRKAFLAERQNVRVAFTAAAAKADEIVANALAQLSLDDRRKLATMRLPPPFGEPGERSPPR